MAKESFKERVKRELIKSSQKYTEIYVDYEYLICSDAFVKKAYYIVDAHEDNFQHLTGVHSNISPKDFFNKCYLGILTENDFDFIKKGQNEKSVKGTVRRKIQALSNMMKLFEDGLQAEENFKKNNVSCSFATADNSCTLGFSESEKVRPKSLIKGNELISSKQVELILRKKAGEKYFGEIVVGNEKALYKYKECIKDLLDSSLL